MKKKITATAINSLRVPDGKRYVMLRDQEVSGFAIRKMASGVATFIFERRPKGTGRLKQETIGRCDHLSVDQARSQARRIASEFSSPDYLSNQQIRENMPTFGEAVDQYVALELSKKKPSYQKKTIGTLNRYAVEPLGKISLSALRRQHVVAVVQAIMSDGKNPTAEMVWVSISNVLNWARLAGHLETNPLFGYKPKFNLQPRAKTLKLGEISKIWEATNCLSETQKAIVRLLILMPFRKDELRLLTWPEIESSWVNIPATRTKNSDPINLYMSKFASRQLPERRNETDLVFSANGTKAIAVGTKINRKLEIVSSVSNWVFHDFRRTFSTSMHERDAPHHIIEACLNHKDGTKVGVAGVYNRATYRSSIQQVMQQWSDVVEAAVGGS